MKKKFFCIAIIFLFSFILISCGERKDIDEIEDEIVDENIIEDVEEEKEESQDEVEKIVEKDEEIGALKPEEDAKLIIWENNDINGLWLREVGREFEEKYGVKVVYEPVNVDFSKNYMSVKDYIDNKADLFVISHKDMGEVVERGLILENDYNQNRIIKDFFEGAQEAASYQGVIYGYPLDIETYCLFYNKEIFPEAPKSYEDFFNKASEFNNPEENKYIFMWDVNNPYYTHSFIESCGGYLFAQNGTDRNNVGIDSPNAINGGKMFLELKEILPLNSQDINNKKVEELFIDGKVGAIINNWCFLKKLKDSDLNFGVAPLPRLMNGVPQESLSKTRLLVISSHTKYPKTARLFAEFATSDEMLMKKFQITGKLPPLKKISEVETIKESSYLNFFVRQVKYSNPIPSISEMKYIWYPYETAIAEIWDQDTKPEEAFNKLARVIRGKVK